MTSQVLAAVSNSAPANSDIYPGSTIAVKGNKDYPAMPAGSRFDALTNPAKSRYNYSIQHGQTDFYFQDGIAPLCIFCAAVFSVFWGTLAGLLIKQINMDDLQPIEQCILNNAEIQKKKEEAGGEAQAPATKVLETLKLVGTKITEGAKAFLYKEYIWLTIWSCSFAIVLGTTVDLLEMSMTRSPTNFPYTATSYLTGSMTSILAGYIGMRIAVYTNTRVTYTCATSVHKGFICAFRGGQVLGFCLVGLAILNIMIIILIFKACWYNQYLTKALAAGQPMNNCPKGDNVDFLAAQKQVWAKFEELQLSYWAAGYSAFNPAGKANTMADFKASSVYWKQSGAPVNGVKSACTAAGDVWTQTTAAVKADGKVLAKAATGTCQSWEQGNLCDLWTAATTNLSDTLTYNGNKVVDEILYRFNGDKAAIASTNNQNCLNFNWNSANGVYDVTAKTWGDAMTDYQVMGGQNIAGRTSLTLPAKWHQSGNQNDLLAHMTLARGQVFDDHFPNAPYYGKDADLVNYLPRSAWIWSDEDQLACMDSYNAAFYTFKQRVCVLTRRMFELVAGYGLGGSSVALFGRVGGGIYTKAADVGADLVGKTLKDLKEDDITNPGTIADNVGDNVGDIAGMGSDLFGSLAESTCAALVVSATSYELVSHPSSLFFPIAVTASGAIASWLSVLLAHAKEVTIENVQGILKFQVGASTVLMTGCVIPAIFILPESFTFEGGAEKNPLTMERWIAYGCVMFGLWSGMIIGFITEYYTNNAYAPTLHLAESCNKGPAPNIILGLALGYLSVVVPIVCITATIGFGFANAGMYGIGLSALGMLGSLPVALSVDGYGPISDNAGGCAEMCGLPSAIRDMTDALDAAGNTTAAVGKGFAIGSACLVGLALFGAFITRIGDTSVDILKPTQFAGLLIGAMLPYFFTALTMRAVGDAAYAMMEFIEADYKIAQEKKRQGIMDYLPDYEGCIRISTEASLQKMVAPGVLVIGSPLCAGFVFGPNATAGVLAGAIVSGVQVAISQSNSGGAWDNAKKEVEKNRSKFRLRAVNKNINLEDVKREYNILAAHQFTGEKTENGVEVENGIEAGFDKVRFQELTDDWMREEMELREQHIAAVVGDTVGDPLKDTSGPAINILVKLSAITSLVFGNYLAHYHFFGNAVAPIRYSKQLLAYCDTAGENPNTVDMVMKNCNMWLEKGYFTYKTSVGTTAGYTSSTQRGIAYPVWYKLDKIAENKA